MSKQVSVVVLVATMIAVIVTLDIVLFRGHAWARLLANVGVVLVFGALYLRFVKQS